MVGRASCLDLIAMISLVIVTYNSRSTIEGCLRSVLGQPGSEVIVVDNDSRDGTAELCRQDGVQIIRSGRNLGFNGGNQLGIDAAKGDLIVFLNPDTLVPAGYAEAITKLFASRPELAVVGCRMQNPDGSAQRACNRFPTLGSLLFEHSGFGRLFPDSRAFKRYVYADWDHASSREVDAVPGSCFAVRRSDLEAAGGLDTGYFLFFEEFDLCRRVKQSGKVVWFESSVSVTHLGGASTRQEDNSQVRGFYLASRDRYIRKFRGAFYLLAFKALARSFDLAAKLKLG